MFVYAWRNWFVSLCGLILLTTLSQHHDMPRTMLGIAGLNPWNLVLGVILVAWLTQRRPGYDHPPRYFLVAFAAYVALLVLGGVRAMFDSEVMVARGHWAGQNRLLFDLILNPLKYVLVGVLFFDGCRTRRQAWLGVHTLLLLGLLHALMMYKTMKGIVFLGNYEDARRMTDKMIGLHANDLAGLLTFAFWSLIVYATLIKGRWRWAGIAAAVVILPAIVGCYSRAAFVANVGLALALGVVRWRKLLFLFPLAAVVVILLFPRVATRLTMGLTGEAVSVTGETDWNEVTAGRTENLWMPTLEQIAEAPLIGHGRLAIWRTHCYDEILAREGNVATHPHNSYLEMLLDSGMVGLSVVLVLLVSLGWMATSMLRSRGDVLVTLAGGMGFVAVVNVAILGLSGQFFYPKESMLWLFCATGLTLRAWCVRGTAVAGSTGRFDAIAKPGLLPSRGVPG